MTMKSVNLDDSWCSKTEIFGYDLQVSPGNSLSPVTFREMLFRKYRGRSSDKLKAKEDKIEGANKQKTLNNRNEEWDSTRWKQSWT